MENNNSKKVHDFDFTNLATAMKTCSIVRFVRHDADFVAKSQSAIYVPASRQVGQFEPGDNGTRRTINSGEFLHFIPT